MDILITGAFGFLGGRLAQHLLSQFPAETRVVLASRRRVAAPSWLPQADVAGDIDSPGALEQALDQVDAVVHLAGMNAQDCAADPAGALASTGAATARLVAAARRRGVRRVIYLSSAHVYGSPLTGSISEDTTPAPAHPYATSHLAGEALGRAAHQRGDLTGIVVRLSNAFGAPAHAGANCWTLLANDLCRQAVTTGRMVVRTSGLQRRDFVPVADVCGAIAHLLRLPAADVATGVFNVGGAWSPTVWEMALLIQSRAAAMLGIAPEVTRLPSAPDETSAALDYRIDALVRSGYRPGGDRLGEIDRLLEFCRT